MATTKNTTKNTMKRPGRRAGRTVRVRMYNIGFGDCFLLFFPAADRPRKVLIDCGVHFQGRNPKPSFDEVVEQLIEDVKEPDGTPRIDVVVATHRHQDHVSGFEKEIWGTVEVGEVWMPWTENYDDPRAREILNKQSRSAQKLHAALTTMMDNPATFALGPQKVQALRNVRDFSENSLKNAAAMETLHKGFKGGEDVPRHFYPHRDRPMNTYAPDALPGVKVHFMGPSHDEDVIRDMDPPASEHWFKAVDGAMDGTVLPLVPFHRDWGLEPEAADPDEMLLTSAERAAIECVSDLDYFSVAKRLEDSVNGTSLMMMFEVGRAHLFFPGDAQHGTWQAALADEEWRDLLTRTSFYKVGHHGSHNATPKEFVEDVLRPKCRAMVSLYPVKNFPNIPKKSLFEAMGKLPVEYARSDRKLPGGDPPAFTRTRLYVETEIPI